MKSVELKKVPMTVLGETQEFDYKAMLQVVLEGPANPEKGAGIAEVRRCIKILDVLDKSDNVLELEDSDFDFLKERVQNIKFTSNNVAFADFVDSFEKASGDGQAN